MTSASIDDLLGYEDEAPAGAPRRRLAGTLVRTVLLAALLTGVIVLGLRTVEIAVPVVLVALGVLALLALRHVVRLVSPPRAGQARPLIAEPQGDDGTYYWPSPDAMRRAVLRWEQRLGWHADQPDTFAVQLQPVLRELADERLRQGYGLSLGGEPDRAREVLGEPLWTALTDQHRRGLSRADLAQAVAALEKLKVSRWEGQKA
jgi:hypothetical protein